MITVMAWTVDDIAGQIHRLEDDRAAWQHQLEDAYQAKVQAQHVADTAQAAEDVARRHVRGDDAEIDQLRAELALQTIPPARIAR